MFNILIDTCVWLDLAKDNRQGPVIGVVEEMVKQKLVTLIVPSLVLDEIRLGWIYPSRFLGTYREDVGASRRLLLYTENFLL